MRLSERIKPFVAKWVIEETKQLESANVDLQRRLDEALKVQSEYFVNLSVGRQYLMSTQSDKITVEDALESFGFSRNGLV